MALEQQRRARLALQEVQPPQTQRRQGDLMFIALEARFPCGQCGCQLRKLWTGYARINKRSMRFRGGIGAVDRTCPECRSEVAEDDQVLAKGAYQVTAEDAEKIRAYRLRRWPELAKETA